MHILKKRMFLLYVFFITFLSLSFAGTDIPKEKINKKVAKKLYSVWLVPCINERLYYQEGIDFLAKKNKTQSVIPHVTLFSTTNTDKKTLNALVKIVNKIKTARLFLNPMGVETNARSVYVKMSSKNSFFEKTVAQFNQAIKSSYVFRPHISLLYGRISERQKKDAVKSANITLRKTCFDKVVIVLTTINKDSFFDVNDWDFIYGKNLSFFQR